MYLKQKNYFNLGVSHQLVLILMIIFLLSSCKTTRQISKSGGRQSGNPVARLIEQVKAVQPKFNTANVSKMAMEITLNERRFNVSVTCKIKKDSVIYFSILPFMGIELYKAELKTDSLRVFDKTNRNYYTTDYGFLSKIFGVNLDFYSMQALLLNQFFCAGEREIQPDSCKLIQLAANRNEIDYQNSGMEQKTELSPTNTIEQVILKEKNSTFQLQTNYADFTVENGVNFPQKITMKATNQKNLVSLDFTILKVAFDSDLKFQAINPDHYKSGDINQLIKK